MKISCNDQAAATVEWLKIPLIGCPGSECGNVIEGEPLSPKAEVSGCGKESRWLLGRVFLCQEHAREVAEALGDDIAEIEAEWRATCV